jgi:catechol 2,3-dioxygenase-like lactoylglutathione lyase family enzyme
MPLKIHELNHVAIHVRDLERSIDFYGRVLELPPLPRPAFNFPGAWFAFGNQELHLIEDKALRPEDRMHHHFALRIDDTFAARAELERRGITQFISHGPRPDGPMQLFFLDPDGYRIEFYSAVANEEPGGGTSSTS